MTGDRSPRSVAEWVTFAVSAAILLALMGTIAWLGIQPQDPARLTVQASNEPREAGGLQYVFADVTNEGDEPVKSLQILAEVTVDGQEVSAEQSIDFLSGGAREEVVFVFDADVPVDAIKMRIGSYSIP